MPLSRPNLPLNRDKRWMMCGTALLVILGGLAFSLGNSRSGCLHLGAEMRQAEQAEGQVLVLDERLATAALFFAESGEPSWRERYAADLAQRNGALARAIADSTPPETTSRLRESTRTAQARLEAIEGRAIRMASDGLLQEANALLSQDEYKSWKSLHRAGINQRRLDTAAYYERALSAASRLDMLILRALQGSLLFGFLLSLFALRLGSGRGQAQVALEMSLRQQADLVQALDRAPAGIVITDLDTNISYANQLFGELAGIPQDSLKGRKAGLLRSGQTPDEVYRELWAALNAGESWSGRLLNRRQVEGVHNNYYWAHLRVAPLLNDDGKCVGYIGAQQDISESIKLEDELKLRRTLADLLAEVSAGLQGSQEFSSRLQGALQKIMDTAGFRDDLGAALIGCEVGVDSEFVTFAATDEFGRHEWNDQGQLERALELGESEGSQLFMGLGEESLTGDDLAGFLIVPFGTEEESRGLLVIGCDTAIVGDPNYSQMLDSMARVFSLATLQWHTSQELERALAEAQRANQAKIEFLGNMSHEIRTPMTSLLGYADMLLEADSSEADRERAGRVIHQSAQDLLAMINGILDISKLESGSLGLEQVQFSPHELATQVVTAQRERAESKSLTLDMRAEGCVPVSIHNDPTRLQQVLSNLVDNAIKFTDEGQVSVVMRSEPRGKNLDLIFEVSDTGVGIPEGQGERIFEAFRQADISITRRFGGSGLGLTMARKSARLLGGDITHQQRKGAGSTFCFRLELGAREDFEMISPDNLPPAALESDPLPEPVQSIPYRLLLAEDNQVNQLLIQRILRKAGASVESVANGLEAVAAALEAEEAGNPYAAILMDLMMPEVDGLTATREIRSKGLTLPIIALTADATDGTEARCMEAGCDGYATKPVDRTALFGLLHKLIEGSSVRG